MAKSFMRGHAKDRCRRSILDDANHLDGVKVYREMPGTKQKVHVLGGNKNL